VKASNPLLRKAGPLPVYAWAGIALAIVVAYLYVRPRSATADATPVLFSPSIGGNDQPSAAQQPASGQGTPADNMSGDLLAALGDNTSSYDALLAALQYGSFGGYGGYSSGYGSGGGGAAGGVPAGFGVAPTIDSGVNNAPVASFAPTPQSDPAAIAASGDVPYTGPLANGDPGYVIDPTTGQVYGPSTAIEGGIRQRVGQPAQPDALDRYLATQGVPDTTTTQYTQPTPTVVQAAPVDTRGVIVEPTPQPTPGRAIAV